MTVQSLIQVEKKRNGTYRIITHSDDLASRVEAYKVLKWLGYSNQDADILLDMAREVNGS